ncbi:MAG: lactate racemase domain-containing protein [Sorangiineae bacterium]|nr:lactate racemase domain-containing protein [Polyangiaceae bacterium]MEB2321028.1 lactate racemase domain-containing protein [Sorangiineae bacterium]
MDHPCLVTLDRDSAPRVLFSGDRLVEVDLPAGTRCIYPKPPLEPLKDPNAAIRYALSHPLDSEPLYAKLRPGMKVTIAIDDISLPLPPMKRPDSRERILTVVLELLADHGVDDVELIVATGIHRRMKASEIRHMVGDRIFDAYFPDRLYNHDAEDPDGIVRLGETALGEPVDLNRRAAESDLLIYVNITFVPMNGGHKSVPVGLASYESLRPHHNPETIRQSDSYMDPAGSELARRIARMGRVVAEHLDVFAIESTVNNRMFDRPLGFLAKNEDELDGRERALSKGLVAATSKLPQAARQAIFDKFPAPYAMTGVWAGATEAVHAEALKKSFEQYSVPITGQADVLVTGIPFISPYNVHAYLNPLLVSVLAQGYLFNMYRNAPLVKQGGTLIITHPCSDKFDHEQHAPYIDFVHRLLPETRDAMKLAHKYEEKFARDPAFIQMYRNGHAYHPAHPFFMWYWGENGRQHLGRVIVVGADNEYIPRLLGWETADSMEDALYMAKGGEARSLDITLLHVPPIVMGEVSLPR